jgi:two-component system LytT family response regulator
MLKAVIIDDETAAIIALQLLISQYIPDVLVVATATDPSNGLRIIEAYNPEIVFLDICMPDVDGFSMLDLIGNKDFSLVFTTAHEKFALQAIKHHASDYLLKPVDIDELKKAIENISELRAGKSSLTKTNGTFHKKLELTGRIGLPVKEGLAYVVISDIVWIGSDGNYSTFYTSDLKRYLVSKNLGEYEDILPEREFFRAHKSHLINVKKVKKYIRTDGYYVEMEDGSVLEISRRKKDDFLHLMNEIS